MPSAGCSGHSSWRGLLLSFTPCVLPMIPILSAIIAGQKGPTTGRRGFALAAVYVLAMSLTYTAAGVMAGLFGQNLQAVFQHPGVLVSFSLLFVVLSLAMFGVYELQLPVALQSRLAAFSQRQRGGSYMGGRSHGCALGAHRRALRGGAPGGCAHRHRYDR